MTYTGEFVCIKCGWHNYELCTIKVDKYGNELPVNEWFRGCPVCKTDNYIRLDEEY